MKLLASDYDDTFYINDSDILKNIDMSFKFSNNNLFVIATGRSYLDFNKVKDKYNIKCDYLVINHGATIVKDDIPIYNQVIDNDIKNELINDLDIKNTLDIFACSLLDSRVPINNFNLTKIHVRYSSYDKTKLVYEKLINKYNSKLNIYYVCNKEALEIVSKDADKSYAIKYISNIENININDIYTIGNGNSDVNMIKDYNGYCMINSIDEVKKVSIKEYNSVSSLIDELINI